VESDLSKVQRDVKFSILRVSRNYFEKIMAYVEYPEAERAVTFYLLLNWGTVSQLPL
jgi:hypothetical protein